MIALLTGCTTPDDEGPLSLPEPSVSCEGVAPVALTPEQQVRQDEVHSFLAQRYQDEGWVILKTTETCVGDRWDWLDPASVPGSEVEPPPPPVIELPPGTELQLTELDLHPELQGPPDSVPMLRPSFAPYVFGDVEASSVEDFLAKSVQSVPGKPEGQNRLYAGINMAAPAIRVQTFINGYDGKVEKTIMSVLEMAVTCQGPDPAKTLELVGVAVSRDRWNFDRDVEPAVTRLQVEFLTAGDATGPKKGGWHRAPFTDFKPLKNAKYGPGVALGNSTIGGPYLDSLFEIRNIAGTWWVLHNHNWLGYYPTELFDVMTFEACEVHWYGEVHDSTPMSWTSSDMGSEKFAAEGLGNAAYFRQPFYEDPSGTPQWPDGAKEATPNDPLCYTSSGLLNQGPLFERILFTSGPGGDSPGCN
jgi:hypothetical protein